ncbi:hypothetical protein GOP47_0003742 [Adiantum capillus-veneris]|uniref:Uncharacterized protein n=1 Tax=Adiantum capillus-veneris TaxID=13818 RepID=A0A9D4ZM63_ADICA|nr:hypothetical protein GOP47_0003742 [Adiantum capillus-veneris]
MRTGVKQLNALASGTGYTRPWADLGGDPEEASEMYTEPRPPALSGVAPSTKRREERAGAAALKMG